MSSAGRLVRLALTDFRERSRRFSFLLTLAFVLYAAFVFLPPNHARYSTMQLGGHRGVYNSAWVGTLVALQTAMFLSLAGFYLVKNTIGRDRRTGVGQVLAATRLSNRAYLAGKTLSNFLVLVSIMAVMVIAAFAMQWIRAEDRTLQPFVLLVPFIFLPLPLLALVAAVATFFESARWLRGGLGNVLYYFLWTAMVVTGAVKSGNVTSGLDPVGIRTVLPQMLASCTRAFPEYDAQGGHFSIGFNFRADGQTWDLTTYEWNGMSWTGAIVLGRLIWLGVALVVLLAATFLFDRFDPALADGARSRGAPDAKSEDAASLPSVNAAPPISRVVWQYEAMPAKLGATGHAVQGNWAGRLFRLTAAELRLSQGGMNRWWYGVAAGCVIACLFAPMELVRAFFFPLAWIWPILIWSALGTREARYGTDALLYSSPRPLSRQIPAIWLSGFCLAAVTGSGMLARLLMQGDLPGVEAWLIGALFIPSLALFLGSAAGSSKPFEILYLVVWYAGPLNKAPYLDFMGTTGESHAAGVHVWFALAALLLLLGAIAARRKRLQI